MFCAISLFEISQVFKDSLDEMFFVSDWFLIIPFISAW